MPTWLLIVILLIVIAIIIWILVSGNPDEEKATVDTLVEPATEEPLVAAVEPDAAAFTEEVVEIVEPDDLKKIEGIGPKISGVLGEKGILTFSQLAKATESELKEILVNAKIRIANPTTWSEQATLAADGKWEELEQLQDELKGGRRA